MIRKLILAGALVGALVGAPAATAHAKPVTVKCPEGRFGSNESGLFPFIAKLQTTGLPAKTYGYAPRCLVAWSAAALVQAGWANGETPPKTVEPQGARWTAGKWRVSMRVVTTEDGAYGKFTLAQGSKRITFEGGS